ncbi:MAG: PD-(D/E)XK nuclease family protein [Parvimonas sp.]|nr:PD-(D/E)XK nuclease family protein [Parvimonas sp.]
MEQTPQVELIKKHKQWFKDLSKYLDEFNFGILKDDITKLEQIYMGGLVKSGYYTETVQGYLLTLKGQFELGINNKQSDKVKELRANKVKLWSFSELEQWNGCQLSYKLQRIDRVPQLHSSYSFYGSLAHDIQEAYVLGNIEYKDMLQQFKTRLERLKTLGVLLPKDRKGGLTIQENYEKCLKDYFRHNYTEISKDVRVEVEVLNQIGEHWILGYIDYLKINRKENGKFYVDIIDFKTSTIFTKEEMKEKARQLILYKILLEKSFPNIVVERVGWDFMKYVNVYYNSKSSKKSRKDNYIEPYYDKLIEELGEEKEKEIKKWIKTKTIPKEYQYLLNVQNCYVYYFVTQEDIDDITTYVENTTKEVELGLEKNEFINRDYVNEQFFCDNLCGFREKCPIINQSNTPQGKSINNILQDILKKRKDKAI